MRKILTIPLTWPRHKTLNRDDITIIGIPFSKMCNQHFDGVRARILMKNIAYVGAIAALLEIDLEIITALRPLNRNRDRP